MTRPGLTFLSWVRTGAIAQVGAPVGTAGNLLDATLPAAATLPVTLALEGVGPAGFDAHVVPPGDVYGFDQAQIIRTDPEPGATGVEPNYLAMIEFDRPDLPWMLTPNAPAEATTADADPRRGLRPWLCLVVVPDQALDPPTGERRLPRLAVPAAQLPDLETAWLWAHAQVLTTGDPQESLEDLLRHQTNRTLSRLICPRRLGPDRRWLACVVPVWEAGRRAGLGLRPLADATLTRAWTHADPAREVVLPVYHAWRFSTGRAGDFESLARRIQGFEYGLAGVRPLDIGHAGAGVPGPAGGAEPWLVDYEGAIVGAKVTPGSWPSGFDAAAYRQALAVRLDGTPRELAPPTYGALHAGFTGSLAAAAGPGWLRELNLDPRYRVAAALGTQIVQRHQEALMASAWEQTAELREANRLLRQAQLAQALGETIYTTRVGRPEAAVLDDERLLQLSAAVHGQLATQVDMPTVAGAIAPNVSVRAAVQVPFRRLARPRGPLARRLAPVPLQAPVQRLGLPADAADKLRPAPPLEPVSGTVDLARLSSDRETLATLAPDRVRRPVFPWEPSPPPASVSALAAAPPAAWAPAQAMPYGFMADLLISTVEPPRYEWQPSRWTATLARSLDTDGIPQLGWEQFSAPPATAIGLGGGYNWRYAATYVDFGGRTGLVSFQLNGWGSPGIAGWQYRGSYSWSPGYLLDQPAGQSLLKDPPILSQLDRSAASMPRIAVAAGDVTGSGKVDVLFLTSSPLSRLTVGFDLDEDGNFTGGLASASLSSLGEVSSAAAAGNRVFVLSGTRLTIVQVNVFRASWGDVEVILSPEDVDLRPYLPDDYRGGALAAADFGGGTGADLVVFYVAGSGPGLRAAYRIASDIGAGGRAAWGADRPAPIPVAGPETGILLGAMRAETARRRAEATAAFRDAAARTQERQQRIVAVAKPPAAAPEVEVPQLASDVRTGLDPAATVTASALTRLELLTPLDPSAVRDPLQPLALAPRFPYPTYQLFRDAFQDRLFPGASRLPDDRATALVVNQAVVEAFLVGLNHELSRELLWRGFPLHHGTYFRSFWDAGRHDITPIEQGWAGALGSHNPNTPTDQAVLLVVRAELLRRIPRVTVYAVPAKVSGNGQRAPDLSRRTDPRFSGQLDPDLAFYGFDELTVAEAAGTGQQDGWYFVFQQHPTEPRFGLDEPPEGGAGPLPNWDELNWAHAVALPQGPEDETPVFLEVGPDARLAGRVLGDADRQDALEHRWAFSAAHMAHITLQRPVQVAIHARRLLPEGGQ